VTLSLLFFVLMALLVVGLLLWASRPPKPVAVSVENFFDVLAENRHCTRLPQILQALNPEDERHLQSSGREDMASALRNDRQRIVLEYLDKLQEEFETLLEVSRILAVMSPELTAMQEFERLSLSVKFGISCSFLRWRLRLGLRPWNGFGRLSGMASSLARTVEQATSLISERSMRETQFPPPV